jgi:type 1 glutamine amidotransferase
MKVKNSLVLIGLILGSLLSATAEPGKTIPGKPLKGIFFVGGCCHDYEKLAPHLSKTISEHVPIRFDVKFNMDALTNKNFADSYDLVVYDFCFEEAEAASLENAFQATRDGKPTVMIHCAIHAFRKSEKIAEWEKLCGMRSKSHDPHQAFSVEKIDQKHPVAKDFPADWKTSGDEIYQTIEFLPGSVPLLKTKSPQDGREHIVCWVHQYGRGRVFATTLGHGLETAESPDYVRLLANGILWACSEAKDHVAGPPSAQNARTPSVE